MATYKVLQDVEAEDKLIGPLTLRQFIYAGVMALCLYLIYIAILKGVAFLAIVLLPVALISGFFAFPWKLNQPTEVWALAKIRFIVKPRRRTWDQNGLKEPVVITAPKQIVTDYTKGLSPNEIQSRLKVLAKTIDSRGWSIKNSDRPVPIMPMQAFQVAPTTTDRLIDIETIPTLITPTDSSATEDVFDSDNSALAQKFDKIIASSADMRKKNIINKLSAQQQSQQPVENIKPQHTFSTQDSQVEPPSNWFVQPTSNNRVAPGTRSQVNQPQPTPVTIPTSTPPTKAALSSMSQPPYADILNLASNNDLNIATLARRVNLKQGSSSDNEVVVPLR